MIAATEAYNTYLDREIIFPKFKVYSFALSQAEPWSEIIGGTYSQTPVDLTPYIESMEFSQDQLGIDMTDESALLFHPDAGALRATIAAGRVIRLKEGFEGLDESQWLWTFSGTIEGSPSWVYQRNGAIDVKVNVYSRGNNQAWKRRNVTSRAFTAGSEWSAMFMNIARDIMQLDPIEIDVPEPWGVLFDKNSSQVVNYPPWDAMEQLLWGISAKPFFNGEGKLDYQYITQDRVNFVLTDDKRLAKYEAKGSSSEVVNKVILTYLSNTLSRVDGADQVLGTASITAGFLLNTRSVDVYYSDERKTRSDNPRLVVRQSVNQTFLHIGSESMTKEDEFHSRVTVTVPIWAGLVLLYLLAAYVALVAAGSSGLPGATVSNVAAAVLLVVILLYISTIGTGSYEVWGTPYEMVYLERQAIAQKSGIEFWQEREKDIRNDFISTQEQAQPLLLTQLHYEVMKEQPRDLTMRYDPRLEPGDVIELSTSVRVYVESIKRGYRRGSTDPLLMTVTGYRTVV